MTYLQTNYIALLVFFLIIRLFINRKRTRDVVYLVATFGCVLLFNVIKDWQHMDDISSYVPTFKYICRPDSDFYGATSYYKMQIGYYWLNKIIGYVSTSHYWFMLVIGCITALPYAMLIRRYSPIVWLSCALYFAGFVQSTYVLRQHSAIGLTILILPLLLQLPSDSIWKALRSRKNIITCFVILGLLTFAILIHPTAIIFVFVICAYFVKNIRMFIVMTLAGGAILYLFLPLLTSAFVDNTAGYNIYMEAENDNKGGTIIMNGFYLVAAFYALRPFDRLPQLWKLLFKVQCIIFAFTCVSIAPGGGTSIPRLLMYLTCFNYIFLPYLATRMPRRMMRHIFVASVFFLAYYMFALSPRIHFYDYNIDKSFCIF